MEAKLAGLRQEFRKLLFFIDRLTDKVTSYRLVLYILLALAGWTIILSFLNQAPFSWYEIIFSAGWLALVCRATNRFIASRRNIPVNTESDLITALILALILSPPTSFASWIYLTLAGAAAMASKYFLSINRKHIFNPAAAGAVFVGLLFGYWPSWWIGMQAVLPLVVVGGFLIARKMKRLDMVGLFVAVYITMTFLQLTLDAPLGAALDSLWSVLTASSLLFFAVIMLTEPYTSPLVRHLYLPYAALVAVLYSATGLEIKPEMALLIGNLAAFIADPNPRRSFKFAGRRQEAEGIETFLFEGKKGLKFNAGQYMEWTLPQHQTDSRGNRRYLTISSSPTESQVAFSVRMPQQMSSFKTGLDKLQPGDKLLGGQLAGRFVLPKSEKTKLAWLAGGVGITPFRSMAKYMTDFTQERDAVLIYFAGSSQEFAFKDVFVQAQACGLQTHYSLTTDEVPKGWDGLTGGLTKKMLEQVMPDYQERLFYISGPYGFVSATEQKLWSLGIGSRQIITDYFPGYS